MVELHEEPPEQPGAAAASSGGEGPWAAGSPAGQPQPSDAGAGPDTSSAAAETMHDAGGGARPGDPLPPQTDSQAVEVADGVSKQVLKEGRGNATAGSTAVCFVHYRAWVASSLSLVEDTWRDQQPAEIKLGQEKAVMRGLARGLASMRSGERALLKVKSDFGYGPAGNFSFPNVPPEADLLYEAELVGFDEGRARGDMMAEERIQAADRRRLEGNAFYKEDSVEDAVQQYEMALGYLGEEFMFQMFGKYRDMADAVRLPCLLNLAACMLRQGRYEDAISRCTEVLHDDEKNVKALFRRAKARAALGQSEGAMEDLKKANKLAPGDKAVLKELQLLREGERQVAEKQRDLYKGMFKKPPEPPKKQKLPWYRALWVWVCGVFRSFWPFKRIHPKKD